MTKVTDAALNLARHARQAAAWWVFVLRYEARELWRALPGPWWVKVLLILVTQAIPGPQDEALLLLIVAACRKRQARRAR